jgi:outer membrane lipoprotein-sorting protein
MKKLSITRFALFLAIAAAGGVLSGQTQGDSGLTEHLKNLEYLESSIQ